MGVCWASVGRVIMRRGEKGSWRKWGVSERKCREGV